VAKILLVDEKKDIRDFVGRFFKERNFEVLAVDNGSGFTAEVIASICAPPEREILGLLSQDLDRKHHLIRTHSIQRLGNQLISCYRFRHILFQKYLYSSLDEVEWVHLHEQVGTTLERLTEYVDGEKLGATSVKGKKKPLEIFKLA